MNCSKSGCGGRLKITHTYSQGLNKYQRAACLECRRVYSLTTVAEEARRGQGARAQAKAAAKRCESQESQS